MHAISAALLPPPRQSARSARALQGVRSPPAALRLQPAAAGSPAMLNLHAQAVSSTVPAEVQLGDSNEHNGLHASRSAPEKAARRGW